MPSRLFAPIPLLIFAAALACPWAAAQVAEEVPFITTPDNVTLAMLQLAQVTERDQVIDLGSGDGRIVITAARRFGARGLGVEIVPELVARSRRNAESAGVSARAEFREQDLFKTDLAGASVITMYLLPEVNLLLRPTLLKLAPGTRIVSHDWDMGDWRPDETLTVDAPDKAIGREKKSVLHRWVVPAQADGLWCAPDGVQVRVRQHYQMLHLQWRHGARERVMVGRLDGARMRVLAAEGVLEGAVEGTAEAQRIRLAGALPGLAPLARARGAECPG